MHGSGCRGRNSLTSVSYRLSTLHSMAAFDAFRSWGSMHVTLMPCRNPIVTFAIKVERSKRMAGSGSDVLLLNYPAPPPGGGAAVSRSVSCMSQTLLCQECTPSFNSTPSRDAVQIISAQMSSNLSAGTRAVPPRGTIQLIPGILRN